MKAIALVLFLVLVASAAPSKQAESDSLAVAQLEFQRMTSLNSKSQYERFVREFWFYESVDDSANFAQLNNDDKKNLKKLIGSRAFFLHRYTPKKGTGVIEVYISDDGRTLLGTQKKPNE